MARQKGYVMQHFNSLEFVALKPAKAKATALAMFAAAQLDAMPDWHAVALALHAAYSPKPRIPKDEIAMADSADAGEFAAWNDLPAPGKGTAMVRGRVTVEFADGYSKTVGLVAGKGKPWSIGKAVAFVVACYQADAARRMTGSDEILYCGEHLLPGLIAVPEIVSVISAYSGHTTAGDLVWSPDAANAATRDLRAGQVDPATGDNDALAAARFEIARRMGLMKTGAEMHMVRENVAAHHRAVDVLFPFPHRPMELGNSDRQELEELFDHLMPQAPVAAIEVAPEDIADAPAQVDPRAELAPVNLETMGLAGAIVAQADSWVYFEEYAAFLNPLPQIERYRLVEDALLAWDARMEPCVFVDGEPVAPDSDEALALADGWEVGPHGKLVNHKRNDGAAYVVSPRAFRNIVEDYKLRAEAERSEDVSAPPAACLDAAGAAETGASPAAPQAVAEPAPRVKPRYRFTASGAYELVTE